MIKLKNTSKLKTFLLGLFLLVLIIFVVNDKTRGAKEIEVLFLDLYHNRLIAENYVYKLNTHFSQKKVELLNEDLTTNSRRFSLVHDSILELLKSFSKTTLTKEEENIFESLKQNIKHSWALELSSVDQRAGTLNLIETYDRVLSDLNVLSTIQVREANVLYNKVKKSSSSFSVGSELFWALGLIILLLLVGVLSNTDARSKTKHSYLLN